MTPMLKMRNIFADMSDAGRINCFLHSRQWPGLPAAVVTAFVVLFLFRRFAEGIPMSEVLWKGAVYALLVAFCWRPGVWASTGDGREPGPEAPDAGRSGPAWFGWALLLVVFALVCSSQIADMVRGESSLARGLGGILLKAMAVAAVVIPVLLARGRR